MSIKLTSPILYAGAHVPVDGATLSYAADLEADLVNRNMAVYVSNPAQGGLEPVMASKGVTGGISLLGPGGEEIQPINTTAYAKKPRILKKFVDLANFTTSVSSVTIATSIDQNSPFGGPALKVVVTPGATGNFNIDITNLDIDDFDGNVCAAVWVDEPHRVASVQVWQCADTTPTDYTSWSTIVFGGGDTVGGHRNIPGGPIAVGATITNGGTGFIAGSSSLKMVRVRTTVYIGANTTLWFKAIFIPAKQRPIACFTFDDASVSWMTRLKPILDARGVKATFGVYSSDVDSGANFVTSADLQQLASEGHQICSHNVNNYAVLTLASNGNGEIGGATAIASDAYVTEYHTARKVLEALGVDPEDFCYHPYVQGNTDTQTAELMRGCGVELARTTVPYQPQPYGYPMGNDAMNLRAWPLGSQKSLVQGKAAIDLAKLYGGLIVFMGHVLADTSADTLTVAESEFTSLLDYVIANDFDILTMRELRDTLSVMGALDAPSTNPSPPVRMIGRLIGANMNSTADQAITLPAGSWVITQVYATKGSISMTTAAGGVYTTTAKGGTAIVAAGQVYTALTGTATDVATLTPAATPTVSSSIYLSLTTGQGAAATADIFVYGRPA